MKNMLGPTHFEKENTIMKLAVKFVDLRRDMMTVEGDNVDYAFRDGLLVITSDKYTKFPKKKKKKKKKK